MPLGPVTTNLRNITLVGTHLPRRCGIATFLDDLASAIDTAAVGAEVRAVAMDDRPEGYRYPSRVWFEINEKRLGEYRVGADFLNLSKVDVVCVQHEYGIYGGRDGSHVTELLRRLRVPVVTTMHTVLKEPTEGQRRATMQLAEVSNRLVVLSERGKEFLTEIYGISPDKVAFIPHGIPDVPFVDPNFYKDQFNVEGRRVILTFGLLSPGKGIENMINALPRVVKKYPDAVYIVLGATHPAIKAQTGESYRNDLIKLASDLGVTENIRFHNKFVDLNELVEFLGAADVYVTPYLNEAQIVSGTLAYALGSGKATVSTPYWYAQEMLADNRGRLTPFGDSEAMGDAIVELFDKDIERHAIRKNAYQYTRPMIWRSVAASYIQLFEQVADETRRSIKPVPAVVRDASDHPQELSEINFDQLRHLTDDCGILQHAKGTIGDRHHGYCVDDNCRALIVVLLAANFARDESVIRWLVERYLSFMHYAFNDDTGFFRNFMSYDRQWLEERGSTDSHARSLWAMGEAVARLQERGPMTVAVSLFQKALPAVEAFEAPRSIAYSLIGIHAYLRKFSGDSDARRLREKLALQLLDYFKSNMKDDWPWLEETLTYANARLSQALMLSGRWMFHDEMCQIGLRSLEWLWKMQVSEEGYFQPVGCDGWFPRGGEKARFDQQPIEASCMIDACIDAHKITGESVWLERAHTCLNWFLGENDLRIPLYDYKTGGCCDGLEASGVNVNQGAESTLAWLLSLLSLYEYHDELEGRAEHKTEEGGLEEEED